MTTLRTAALALLLAPSAFADAPAVCPYEAGALPAQTLAPGTPHGAQIPVDTIVVVMQENRSFDHYLGRLHDQGQRRAEALPAGASNPDPTAPTGPPVLAFHQPTLCTVADLSHSWNGSHRSWNGGAMDGFTAVNTRADDPTGARTMGWLDRTDIPYYYKLYKKFAIGDRHFCSILGPTYPNRFYLLAGTSFGHIRNDLPPTASDFTQPSIFNLLDDAGVSWRVYYSDVAFALTFAYVRAHEEHLVPIAQLFSDAAAGTLPSVAFVDPDFLGENRNDEHPPQNPQLGQAFVAGVVRALIASPQWPRLAVFVTYDEHGGYYDHVPPPAACVPDDIPPNLRASDDAGAFDRYGVRVPVVVVSPYARRRFVSHVVHDHTSILRFIEARFDLPALTRRDANADPMLEFFDFARARVHRPGLPEAIVDPIRAAECGSPSGAFVNALRGDRRAPARARSSWRW